VTSYLFDTSFLIEYFNEVESGTLGPARRFRSRQPRGHRVYASVVSLAELLEGSDDPSGTERAFHSLVQCLGLYEQHGRRAGLLQRRARGEGARLGENDAWIAATATLADLTVVGDDDAAFADRPGLSYVNFRRQG
jgi:predicted nucleic acid-binding protein